MGGPVRRSPVAVRSTNSGQRVDKAIKYVPLKEIDAAVKNGNLPALTVIPLRLVTVHAVVPYKKQVDEIKRALRLPNPQPILDGTGKVTNKLDIEKAEADARQWGPWYDGFEVQRLVYRTLPDGTLESGSRTGRTSPRIRRTPAATTSSRNSTSRRSTPGRLPTALMKATSRTS